MGYTSSLEGFPMEIKTSNNMSIEDVKSVFFNFNANNFLTYFNKPAKAQFVTEEQVEEFLKEIIIIKYDCDIDSIIIDLNVDCTGKWYMDMELAYQLSLILSGDEQVTLKFYGEDGSNWGYVIGRKSVKDLEQRWFCGDVEYPSIYQMVCANCGSTEELITIPTIGNVCKTCITQAFNTLSNTACATIWKDND